MKKQVVICCGCKGHLTESDKREIYKLIAFKEKLKKTIDKSIQK